ncbi:hypothetical protein N2152v2_001571 [Parachlorella kessleri]
MSLPLIKGARADESVDQLIEEALAAAPVAAAADNSNASSAQPWSAEPQEATVAVPDLAPATGSSDSLVEAATGAPFDLLGPLGGAAVLELGNMERQLQQATRSAEAALASVKDLQSRVEAQTREAQTAAAHMRELRMQLEARSQEAAQLQGLLEEREGTLAAVQAAKRSAEASVADLSSRLAEAQAAGQATQGELQARLEQMEAVKAELQQVRRENSQAQEDLVTVRKERESLKFKVLDSERNAAQAVQQLASSAAAFNAERDAVEAALAELRQSQQRQQAALDKAAVEQRSLEGQLRAKVADLVRERQTSELKEQALQKQVEDLEEKVEAGYRDQNELLRRLEDEAAEVARLQGVLERAEADADAARALVAEERARGELLEKARAAAVQDARSVLGENRELKFALQDATQAVTSLQAELSSTKEELAHITQELEAAQGANERLEQQLAGEHTKLAAMEEDIQMAAKDAKDAVHREMEALAAAERLKEELADAQAAAEAKSGKLGEAEQQLKTVRKQLADQMFMLANADANAEEAKKFRDVAMQLKEERARVESAAKGEIRRLSLELASLREADGGTVQALEAASKEAEGLREELAALRQKLQESEQERAILQATASAFNSAGTGPTHLAKPPKRPRKPKSGNGSGSGGVDNGLSVVDPVVDPDSAVSADTVAAERVAAANMRAAQIRAEAALLVETVEDRAHEAIQEAQAQTARHAEEVDRLKAELQRMRGGAQGA